jgi:UDP-glucose 4,6-dehydratase
MPFNNIDYYRNYLSKLLSYPKLLNARNSLTHLDEFAKCCVDCIQHKVPYGIYNLTNGGSVTTRQVTEMLTTIDPNRNFNFFEDETEFMSTVIAPRSNCVLDNNKAISAGLLLRPIEEALEHAITNWK